MKTIRNFLVTGTMQTTRALEESKPTPSVMDMHIEEHNLPPLTWTSRARQFFDRHPWVFYLLVALAVGVTIFGFFMVIVPGRTPSNTNEQANQLRHVPEAPVSLQSNTNFHEPKTSISKEVVPPKTSTSTAPVSKKTMPTSTLMNTASTSKNIKSSVPSTSATTADCPSPKGSFLDTCKVEGSTYQSTDPNLQSTTMCQYDLHCERLDGTVQSTRIYVQASMRGCLKFFENCNGNPVLRDGNERVCTTTEAIKRESSVKMEL